MREIEDQLIDYYIKGFDISDKQKLKRELEEKFPPRIIQCILDKENNYKNTIDGIYFYSMKDIEIFMQTQVDKFEYFNKFMTDRKRYPLFPNPEDTVESIKIMQELVKIRPASENCKIIGCKSYNDYQPKEYIAQEEKTNGD